jgi:hypothetical protein
LGRPLDAKPVLFLYTSEFHRKAGVPAACGHIGNGHRRFPADNRTFGRGIRVNRPEPVCVSCPSRMCVPFFLFCILTLAALTPAALHAQNKAQINLLVTGSLSVQLEPNRATMDSVPLLLRDVPIHPDDGYARDENIAPISQGALTRDWLSAGFQLDAALEGTFGPAALALGVRGILDVTAGVNSFFDKPARRRRNYTNAPGTDKRGYGAALTYVCFCEDRIQDLRPRAAIFSRFASGRAYAELSIEWQRYHVINGWDRYDSFEVRERHELAAGTLSTLRIGVQTSEWRAYAGYGWSHMQRTTVGGAGGLRTPPHFVVGVQAIGMGRVPLLKLARS